VLAVVVGLIWLTILRPTSVATVGDSIEVECDGIGSDETCEAWAMAILAAGPGIRTFDPDDLVRLQLTRPVLLPGECRADYFISREPDEPAARETVDCPAG